MRILKNFLLSAICFAVTVAACACTNHQEPVEVLETLGFKQDTYQMHTGETLPLEVEASLAIDKIGLEFSSDDEAVATVSAEGVVTAVKEGRVEITATSTVYKNTASCTVVVSDVTIAISPDSFTLDAGQTRGLTLTLTEGIESRIEWSSENEAVATVDGEGVVTGVGTGSTRIVATETVHGVFAKCDVTVVDRRPFTAGTGAEDDPYIILTAAELGRFAQFANGEITPQIEVVTPMDEAHYALGADIDMKGVAFSPVTLFKGGFDGKGHTLSNLTVTPVGTAPTALFGSTDGANISNITLENVGITVTEAAQLMTAAVVGQCSNSTVENCSVKGKVSSTASASFAVNGNGSTSVVAGIVAYAKGSTVNGCTFEGEVSGAAQLVGGIVAQSDNSTIENCSVTGGTAITGLLNQVGGIAAQVRLDSKIKGCKFDGALKCKFAFNGGIAGRLEGGVIDGCVVGSNADVQGHTGNTDTSNIGTGGIVGHILTNATNKLVRVSNCACYCDVAANLAVGGIAGVVRTSTADEKIYITNCLYNGSLTAITNNSYFYSMVGGILGFCDKKNGTVTVANCAGLVDGISFKSTATKVGAGGIGGVLQYNTAVSVCYSTLEASDIVSHDDGLPITSSVITYYGGIFGASHGSNDNVSYSHCYHSTGCQIGANKTTTAPTTSDCGSLSRQEMTDGTLLAKLNAGIAAYNTTADADMQAAQWVAGVDGYPVPSTVPADFTTPDTSGKTRVSVIGDSISTFAGYIPTGYTPFYPKETVTSATQTYWYKLIYNKMNNAKLDTNIAWSGTTVTRIVNSSYEGQHWYGNDFCARFIAKGMGNPDVILIHGGTNDVWESGRGVVYLCPDYGINGTELPADTVFEEIYAKAAAAEAQGRAEIEKLDDTYFISAYVKLITLVHQQYPQAKVVLMIGEWLGATARQTLLKIADHYGAAYGYKCVDFQEIESYRGTTVITKVIGDCHPDENGFEVMADYIYKQVGDYIDR